VEFDAAVISLQRRQWTTADEACEAIFEIARARWGYFLRLTRGHVQDAEDLLVDTVVSVLQPTVATRQVLEHPVSYILVSAQRAWSRRNSSRHTELAALESYRADLLRLAEDRGAGHATALLDDQIILARVISDLPDGEKRAVITHGLMGLSFGDAAEHLGVSRSTVQVAFGRAVKKMRDRLVAESRDQGVKP
jgi:RNA polymerase sigma factor (sigma-70 family)